MARRQLYRVWVRCCRVGRVRGGRTRVARDGSVRRVVKMMQGGEERSLEGGVMCVRNVWSVAKKSGDSVYGVGDVDIGAVFGKGCVLVSVVVV